MFKWWNVVFQFSIFNGKKINYIHIRLDIVLGKLILYRILGRFFSSEINLYADLMNNANNEKNTLDGRKNQFAFLKITFDEKIISIFWDWLIQKMKQPFLSYNCTLCCFFFGLRSISTIRISNLPYIHLSPARYNEWWNIDIWNRKNITCRDVKMETARFDGLLFPGSRFQFPLCIFQNTKRTVYQNRSAYDPSYDI